MTNIRAVATTPEMQTLAAALARKHAKGVVESAASSSPVVESAASSSPVVESTTTESGDKVTTLGALLKAKGVPPRSGRTSAQLAALALRRMS